MTYKLFTAFLILLTATVQAVTIEQKKLDFPVKAELLLKGENHYFFQILSPRKLAVQYPEIANMDSLALLKNKKSKMMVTKSVIIVNKPVGFFDDKQLTDDEYVNHIMDSNKVKKLTPESFKVNVPGEDNSYKMFMYFDADDISTLPNSKVIRAVAAAKKLDVISQGASTTMVIEKTDFNKYVEGAVSVASIIPMKENKTLIITYSMWALKKPYPKSTSLEASFRNEIEHVKELQESFKPR